MKCRLEFIWQFCTVSDSRGRYSCNKIEIEYRQWDPSLPAPHPNRYYNGPHISSRHHIKRSKGRKHCVERIPPIAAPNERCSGQRMNYRCQKETARRHTSAAAADAAGKGLGKMGGDFAKDMLLGSPVTMADWLHAMPMLYSDETIDRGLIGRVGCLWAGR